MEAGVQGALACGADVCLGGELPQASSPLRKARRHVRSLLHPRMHPNLPKGAFEMTSRRTRRGTNSTRCSGEKGNPS